MTERTDHAVVVPIYTTSTYLKQSPHHPSRSSLVYARMTCPNFTEAEKLICEIYQSKYALLVPSGLNALTCVMEGLCDWGDKITILADIELYCSSRYFLLYLMKRNVKKVHVDFVDFTDTKKLDLRLEKKSNKHILYCESCSNPSGRMIPLDQISAMAQKHLKDDVCLVVDNSWLSSLFNPFDHGTDILIESASKYMGGGDIIMGIVTTRDKKWFDPVKNYTRQCGIRVAPTDAYTLCKSVETLNMRVKQSSEITMQLASFLESEERPCRVNGVMYPLLASHPTFHVAKSLLKKGGPSVLIFCVDGDSKTVTSQIDQSSKILFATSYGKATSLFDPWPKQKSDGTWIRLAVGFKQSFEEIRDELQSLFGKPPTKDMTM